MNRVKPMDIFGNSNSKKESEKVPVTSAEKKSVSSVGVGETSSDKDSVQAVSESTTSLSEEKASQSVSDGFMETVERASSLEADSSSEDSGVMGDRGELFDQEIGDEAVDSLDKNNISTITDSIDGLLTISQIFEAMQNRYHEVYNEELSTLSRDLLCYDHALLVEIKDCILPFVDEQAKVDSAVFINQMVQRYMSWDLFKMGSMRTWAELLSKPDEGIALSKQYPKLMLPTSKMHKVMKQTIWADLMDVLWMFNEKYDLSRQYRNYCMFLPHKELPKNMKAPSELVVDFPQGLDNYYTWMLHGLAMNLDYLTELLTHSGEYDPSPLIEINSHLLGLEDYIFNSEERFEEFKAYLSDKDYDW